jgi:hypothetical protein
MNAVECKLTIDTHRLLTILMALVPIICALLARMFEPTESRVQMKVQGW